MKKLRYVWQLWLRGRRLGGDVMEHEAEICSGPSVDDEYLAHRIVRAGSETSLETWRGTISLLRRYEAEVLLEGRRLDTGNYIVMPWVSGVYRGKAGVSRGASLGLVIRMKSAFRVRLHEVKLEVLGYQGLSNMILAITDRASGRRDGGITLGDDLLIEGKKIKVVGYEQPDGGLEDGIGVYFVDGAGVSTAATRIDDNTVNRVLVRVPAGLRVGEPYTLEIRTRYTRGSLSSSIRTFIYDSPVTPLPRS
jgi:hypothetical protein